MSEKMYSLVNSSFSSSSERASAIASAGAVLAVCCCLLFPDALAARAAQAETLPARGGKPSRVAAVSPGSQPPAVQPPAPSAQGVKAPSSAGTSEAAFSRTNGKKPAPGRGGEIRGFSKNPFGLEHRTASRKPAAKGIHAGSGGSAQGPAPVSNSAQNSTATSSRVVFSGGSQDEKKDDRLSPRRSTFSGGPDTLPRMDEETPPEVSLTYKMNERTSTRFSINQQDETSPLYRPARKESGVNSAGVYMDVEVQDNLQLRIGGEYHEVDQNRYDQDESAQGAAIGLRWNF